jgi:cell division protease FtsH
MRHPYKINLLWLVLLITFIFTYRMIADQRPDDQEVRWGELITFIESGHLENVTVQGQKIEARFKENAYHNLAQSDPKYEKIEKTFTVVGPKEGIGEQLRQRLEKLDKDDASFEFLFKAEETESFLQSFIISWLPMLILLAIFFFFMKQLQGNSGRAMSFGKSRARLLNENQKKVTFDDVAGVDEAKEELQEVVAFLKSPQKFTKLGGRIPKGVLLMGPPGTGKTLLARGVAGEADVPFFSISGSDFVEMFVGVGASRVRDLFEQAKKHAPCIIFIDEIDAVGRQRGAGLGGGHDEREQTLNQLLVEMDGFEHNEGVILIAATNRPDVLDPALLRPGRFDRRVVVSRPDVRGREKILRVHTRDVPLNSDCELDIIAKGTPGFSGADLENLVNEAALQAARLDQDHVEMKNFESAKDKVLMGTERRSMIISEHEKRTTAYHEAGHTLVALLLPGTDPVHKVTIIPRGRALGVTQQLPQEDRLSMTKDFAEKRIAILMGGRIAEELIFDQITTGAGQDIEMATDTARNMVCQWGMSKKLGPLAFSQKNEQIFLGRSSGGSSQRYSEATAQLIDEEVRQIVKNEYDRAHKLLTDNLDKLENITQALLERETLNAAEIKVLSEGKELPPFQSEDTSSAPKDNVQASESAVNSENSTEESTTEGTTESSEASSETSPNEKLSSQIDKTMQVLSQAMEAQELIKEVDNKTPQWNAQTKSTSKSESTSTPTDNDNDDQEPPSLLNRS